jgi:hypothetical protein
MTQQIRLKTLAKQELQTHFGKQWMKKVSKSSGFSYEHVRRYFTSDMVQEKILVSSVQLVEDARAEQAELIERLEP